MKKIRSLIFLPGLILLIACDQGPEQKREEHPGSQVNLTDTLQVHLNRTVELLPEARKEVSGWLAYATARDVVENLHGMTGTEITAGSNNIVQIMETLRTTLPDTLQTPAVEARSTVLLTKARVLHQIVNTKNKDPKSIFDIAQDIILEFDNFELQLNEVFLDSPSDFEKELDKEFEASQESNDTLEAPANSREIQF